MYQWFTRFLICMGLQIYGKKWCDYLHQQPTQKRFWVGFSLWKIVLIYGRHRHRAGIAALGLSCGACFEEPVGVFASRAPLYLDKDTRHASEL